MAESLDDGEFWLPPQFLTDDDLFFDKNKTNSTTPLKGSTKADFAFGTPSNRFATEDPFPLEFPYGFDICGGGITSDHSSPVDSAVGSAEHSDEEDLLTCKMVFGDSKGNEVTFGTGNAKGWAVSGSPQSTLCGVGSGCRCRKLSIHGSPNQCSRVTLPTATWDLLHAAAGEVARMRMDEEGCIKNSYRRGVLSPLKKSSPVPVNMRNSNPDFGYFQKQSVAYQKLQAAQFHQLRQQQVMKQGTEAWGSQTKGGPAVYFQQQQVQPGVQVRGRNIGRQVGLSSSVWPPIQQPQHRQAGSGMRAVFLADHGAKRECTGTGVFLPRQICTPAPTASQKKTACATVLLPAKVVQALKLDDGSQKPQLHRLNGTFIPGGEYASRPRNCNVQKRNLRPQPEFSSTETRLPKEWTY